MAAKVLNSIQNDAGDHCVDVFQREDGSFGFEEYRRDAEDARWFSLQRYAGSTFASAESALAKARAVVPWLVKN